MKKTLLTSATLLLLISPTVYAKSPQADVCWAERTRYAVFTGETRFNCLELGDKKLTVNQIYELGYRVVTTSTAQLNNGTLGITLIVEKRNL